MVLRNFTIRDTRSISFAECINVPQLMVIAGPNGVGKSSLLYALRFQSYGTIYIGPYRAIRRQNVQQRNLISRPISYTGILMSHQLERMDGVNIGYDNGVRDPWSSDDASSFLKFALCQIDIQRSQAIAQRYDKYKKIPEELPEPWYPLNELLENLLPHLSFYKIDNNDTDKLRCLFKVHNSKIVDIDDLSSGEKSIIQMFYPLVEHRIQSVLREIKGDDIPHSLADLCLLVDEPELHLHPNLQLKVLDYFRALTVGTPIQVILTTHSPTMVESASFEELYLLKPSELIDPGENQLVQIAENEEKLRFLRDTFGTTSNITALQPIVIIEGVSEKAASQVASDRKLFRSMSSDFDKVTIIPAGGKGQCKALLDILQPTLLTFSNQLRAVALLDRDHTVSEKRDDIFLLPVQMIENFLVDPESIWKAIQSVIELTEFRSVKDITIAIDEILDELEKDEIERRALSDLGITYFRPGRPLLKINDKVEEFLDLIKYKYSPEKVNYAIDMATNVITNIKLDKRRREEFHGKSILDIFYKKYLHCTSLSKIVFTILIAQEVKQRNSVQVFFKYFFSNILPEKSSNKI